MTSWFPKHYYNVTRFPKHYYDITRFTHHDYDIIKIPNHYYEITTFPKHYYDITRFPHHYDDMSVLLTIHVNVYVNWSNRKLITVPDGTIMMSLGTMNNENNVMPGF